MHYTIYKITNTVNNKVYIGKHQTQDLNDGYMGSGKLLKRAIRKHGPASFLKEIIHVFDNEEDMNAKEKELVNEDHCKNESTYNLCVGGHGGFGYINNNGLNHSWKDPVARRSKLSKVMKDRYASDPSYLAARSSHLKHISCMGRQAIAEKYPDGTFKGREHTVASKQRIGKANAIRQAGANNSQHGSIWITDGTTVTKLQRDETIPEGFRRGRK
jgi:hypothetical protein